MTCLMRFAGYYTVGGLLNAHKVLTRRSETVAEIIGAVDYPEIKKKSNFS